MLLAVVVLLALALHFLSPSPWWLELLRYMPFPVYLAPAVLALVFSLFIGVGWIVASCAATLLVATVVMGFVWHGDDTSGSRVDSGPAGLRVMTYNIKAAKALLRLDGVAYVEAEVRAQRPDVVVMQDAGALMEGRDRAAPLFGFPEVFADGQYVIASRLPLRECALQTADTGVGPIAYAHCRLQVQGTSIDLVTVHFESPRTGLNAARREGAEGFEQWRLNYEGRLGQSLALAFQLAGGERPLIVAGDLNAPDASAVVGSLLGIGLRDAFASAGRGWGYTYGHALRPAFSFLRIDHVLVSAGIEVRDCFVGADTASEHRPVVADLRIRSSR